MELILFSLNISLQFYKTYEKLSTWLETVRSNALF